MLDLDERFDSATRELHDLIDTVTVAPASRVIRRHRRRRRATAAGAVVIAGFGVVAIAGIAARDDQASNASASTPDSQATPPDTAVDTTSEAPQPIPNTVVELEGVSSLGDLRLADESIVAVGLTAQGQQACLIADGIVSKCDHLPQPVSPATIPSAHVVQSVIGTSGRHVIWGVIQDGFTAAIEDGGSETPVVVSRLDANGLSGFAQASIDHGTDAQIVIRDSHGEVVQTAPLGGVIEAPTASSPSVTTHEVSGDIGPLTYAVDVVASVGEESSGTLVGVPANFRIDVTKLVLHNPYLDDGTAELLRNGDVLYQWDVGAMDAREEVQPSASAAAFDGSDTITLVLRCEGTTKVDRTGCQISLTLIGRAVLTG